MFISRRFTHSDRSDRLFRWRQEPSHLPHHAVREWFHPGDDGEPCQSAEHAGSPEVGGHHSHWTRPEAETTWGLETTSFTTTHTH